MKKLNLNNVSLVAVTTNDDEKATIKALNYSSKDINFKKKILFTDKTTFKDGNIEFQIINKLPNVSEWGKFIVFELYKYIQTDYIILIHSDGFVVNAESWINDFLKYDYIGAPWRIPRDSFSYRDKNGNLVRVGNSVSLRSKKLLEMPKKIGLKWENFDRGFEHEDGFICVQNRLDLIRNGIVFPPIDIACKFGREYHLPEHINLKPFSFHKWHGPNKFYPCFDKNNIKIKLINKFFIRILRFFKIV